MFFNSLQSRVLNQVAMLEGIVHSMNLLGGSSSIQKPRFPCPGLDCCAPNQSAVFPRQAKDAPRNQSRLLLGFFETNTLRQEFIGQRLTNRIRGGISQLAKTIQEAQRVHGRGVDAHAHGGVASLHALQGGARGESAVGEHSHRQSSSAAGITQIAPKISESFAHASRWMMRSWHKNCILGESLN
jgi:hypothetical protein